MSAKRTSWNEFSSSMASAIICLSTGRKFNFSKYIFVSLVRNVDSSTKFYMYLRFLQLMIRAQVGDLSSHTTKYLSPALTQKVFTNMRRVGKGFFRVETPLFKGMIVAQEADDVANEGVSSVDVDDVPAAAAEPSIPSPTPTTQPPPPSQELPFTSQVIPTPPLSPIAKPSSSLQQQQPSQPTHVAKIMDLLHTLLETCTTLTRKVEALEQDKVAQALKIIKLKQRFKKLERKNKLKVSGLKRLRKVRTTQRVESYDDTVMDDQEDASKQGEIIAVIDTDEDVTLKDDDELEPAELKEVVEVVTTAKLITEVVTVASATITAATTPIIAATITMDYFKGMSYDKIRPIFKNYFNSNVAFLEKSKEQLEEEDIRALKRKTKSSEEKAAKKQKLDEEVEELKKHLHILPNIDNDVYTKATPLALKVPVIDYEIYTENNKPYFKIIRADGTHQLFLSFLSLLRNFDREDLEPDVEAQVWKSQRGVYGLAKVKSWQLLELCEVHVITLTTTQMILLVERKYPLTRFTLDQMLNNVRLEVEEESKVSLELLRFGASCTQRKVFMVLFSTPFILSWGASMSSDSLLPSILLLVVIIVTVVIVMVILIVFVVVITRVAIVVIGGVSSILKLSFVIIVSCAELCFITCSINPWVMYLPWLQLVLPKQQQYHQQLVIRWQPESWLSGGRVIDLTGDEDPTDEDGDTGLDDSKRVTASLGGEISSGEKKYWESNSYNIGGITVGEVIGASSGGICGLLASALYACIS
nr:hypothetical protein [Tanacetum cinerariifolium]